MSKIEKLIRRLKSKPTDFTWDELAVLLKRIGFKELQGSGSRVKFYNEQVDCLMQLHKPHPHNTLKRYVVHEVLEILIDKRLI
ncbi:hypothetical protein BH10PSE19_BH10PSE19_15110 [soil metagenome]